ncbi:putative Tobamovirus multiplication protein [Cocos nucifera]|uniref:Putative Tobamovirus multiplication protein n=1 Tax=Cocos nucifera TaxID=13894 RepID=A0A8K0ILX6_COCNU|nr:putative Tobamovirus multiplication protein [Cocos nucifera]
MACRGFWECMLKLFNFLLTLIGLAMVGYGVYLLVEWNKISSGDGDGPILPVSDNNELTKLRRPMLAVVTLSESILDKLPNAWVSMLFIHEFLALVEMLKDFFFFFLFVFQLIPADKTGDFDMMYGFLMENWKIAKWVALGAVILEMK